MFTGIITDVGEIIEVTPRETGVRLRVATSYDPATIDLGASIAHAGVCMTVVETGTSGNRRWFDVEASPETLDVTTMAGWTAGTKVNLERPLSLGQELGGHLVTGHIDGIAELVARDDVGDMTALTFRVPAEYARFIAAKGSIALDGTSLTVNKVGDDTFTVMLIPHTLTVTTWGGRKVGDRINFEVDMMARYAARLADTAPKVA